MGLIDRILGKSAQGVAGAALDVAKGAADIVERWAPSDAKRHEMAMDIQNALAKAAADARSYDPRSAGVRAYSEYVNVTVDAFARLIRPGVTIYLLGAVFGWWPINMAAVDSRVGDWAATVFAFWFGVRSVTEDIPKLIKAVRSGK